MADVKIRVIAEDATKGVFSSVAGNLKSLGKVAIAGLAAIGAAGAGAAAGIVAMASAAEPLVGLQNGFAATTERMGSSAQVMLASLQEASGGLITNRQLMESFNKAAALVGDTFAESLPDAMSLVQRAAQSTGQDFGFLMDSLVTGVGRVSPMILDNLGIQVSLAEVTARAAEMFGDEAEAMGKSAQQAALNEIVLEKLTKAYGDVETSAQPIASIPVMFANLRDEIGLKLLPVVQPLAAQLISLAQQALPALMGALDRITPILTGISTTFGRFIADLSNGVTPMQALEDMMARLTIVLGGNSATAMAVRDTFNEIVAAVQSVITVVQPYIEMAAQWVAENIKLQDVLIALGVAIATVVVPIILSLATTILPIIAVFAAVALAAAALRQAWESNFLGIRDKVQAVIAFLVPFLQNAIATVREWWAQNGAQILAKAQEIWTAIQTAIQTIIAVVQQIIQTTIGQIQVAWSQHGDQILASAQRVWDSIKNFIDATINLISNIIQSVVAGIQAFWEAHGQNVLTFTQGIWDAIMSYIQGVLDQISIGLDAFASLFRGDWEGFINGVKDLWENGWQTIVNVVSTLWDSIQPLLAGIGANLVSWFSEKAGEFAAAGTNLITSLANAIKTRANNYLKSVAQGVANLLPQWVKNILGIGSPSKVFLEIGANLGNSLALGLRDTKNELQRAATDVTRTLVNGSPGGMTMTPAGSVQAAAGRSNSFSRTVTYQINATYPYRPESDLKTDIRTLQLLRG